MTKIAGEKRRTGKINRAIRENQFRSFIVTSKYVWAVQAVNFLLSAYASTYYRHWLRLNEKILINRCADNCGATNFYHIDQAKTTRNDWLTTRGIVIVKSVARRAAEL